VTPKKTSVVSVDVSGSPWLTMCSSFVIIVQHFLGESVTCLESLNIRASWRTDDFEREAYGEMSSSSSDLNLSFSTCSSCLNIDNIGLDCEDLFCGVGCEE